MSKVLALDTSSDLCSVSLHVNNDFYSIAELAPRKHAQLLLPMVQKVLKEQGITLKELDAIAFGCGPGSFTGLRIAAGVTQGLSYGLNCPVIPVSNLRALALQGSFDVDAEHVLVAIDARMDEVYWSLCRVDLKSHIDVVSLSGEQVSKPESVYVPDAVAGGSVFGIGSGFEYFDRFSEEVRGALSRTDAEIRPHAEAVCRLAVQDFDAGVQCKPEQAAPVYIRDEVAWKKLPGRE